MNNWKRNLPAFLLVLSALMLGFAPLLMDRSYNWIQHTTSESAGQLVDRAWFARTAFVIYGIAVILLACFRKKLKRPQKLAFIAFGLSMFAVALFSHRPWTEGIEYNVTEDNLHSIASAAVGISFIASVLTTILFQDKKDIWTRVLDIVAISASIIIPLSMTSLPHHAGLLQRIMFLISYCWYGCFPFGIRTNMNTE